MSSLVQIGFHRSAFPEQVKHDLLESLRERQVNHKFHYDSVKQTQKWLALHQAYSPSRTDLECTEIYDRSFEAVATQISGRPVDLIGLGCGGGQKDSQCLKALNASRHPVSYTPLDVSSAMVLVAREKAIEVIPPDRCFPVVCDLGSTEDWSEPFAKPSLRKNGTRLFTFFGMLPNFEPELILPRLSKLVGADDYLLLSANLAPGTDYEAGIRKILPLYDNELTRDWLMTFLLDLGLEREDGEIIFSVEEGAPVGLKRITANFHFTRPRTIEVHEEIFGFGPGDRIRLFFSYRHTPALVRDSLAQLGMKVMDQWITRSEVEGVFLVRRD